MTLQWSVIVRKGRRLGYFTVGWNAIEGLIEVLAGVFAGDISLIGFGMDSFIEVTLRSVLLWRLAVDGNLEGRKRKAGASDYGGHLLLALAIYMAYESAMDLWSRRAPERSTAGFVFACVSLLVMPLLSRGKAERGADG